MIPSREIRLAASALAAVVALAATGCESDFNLGNQIPPPPAANPVELEDPVKTDSITQLTTPTTDVLWVIDNSCSMSCVVGCHGNISEEVAKNFPAFMDYFVGSGLDYHIGVITTDTDDPNHNGKLVYGLGEKYIDPQTSDPTAVFFDMAVLGTEGSGQERGLETSFVAMDELGESYNAGMFREAGALHTIVLSNEDNAETPKINKGEYIDWYDSLKEDEKDRTFDSIVCLPSSTGDMCSSGLVAVGASYLDVTREIGGITWDISHDDWASLLDMLGAQAAGLRREYFLSQIPVPGTIVVEVEEQTGALLTFVEDTDGCATDYLSGDWDYDKSRNSITFCEYIPGPLSTIMLTYTVASSVVGANPETTQTTLTAGGQGN